MTNKEFGHLYLTCEGASKAMFNIVGLRCKRFTKHCADVFEKIKDEEQLIYYDCGLKEGNTYKTNENGIIVIPAENLIKFDAAINKLYAKSLSKIDLQMVNVFEKLPTISDNILKDMPPSLFEILNKYIFDISDEEYLTAINP